MWFGEVASVRTPFGLGSGKDAKTGEWTTWHRTIYEGRALNCATALGES
jgi:hypothetical protein